MLLLPSTNHYHTLAKLGTSCISPCCLAKVDKTQSILAQTQTTSNTLPETCYLAIE